jgi:hypothetical protein
MNQSALQLLSYLNCVSFCERETVFSYDYSPKCCVAINSILSISVSISIFLYNNPMVIDLPHEIQMSNFKVLRFMHWCCYNVPYEVQKTNCLSLL